MLPTRKGENETKKYRTYLGETQRIKEAGRSNHTKLMFVAVHGGGDTSLIDRSEGSGGAGN